MLRVAGSSCLARPVVPRPGPRAHKRNLATHSRQRIAQPIQRVLTPSLRPLVPRAAHTTEPVRLNDEYTYFADRIQKRARWERVRNWAVFAGTAALGSAVAEATMALSGIIPPEQAGAGLAFGGIALSSAAFQWLVLKLQGVRSIPTSMGGRPANPAVPKEVFFRDTVHELAKIAGLPKPPEVFIIPAEEMNAFAAGTRPGSQITAATTALLRECTQEEIRAVMAHEIGHLRNGDGRTAVQMIVMNAGFFAVLRLGMRLMSSSGEPQPQSRDGKQQDIRKPLGIVLTAMGLFFVVFGTLFQAKTSRRREFDADASCVAFTRDNQALASALRKIAKAKPSSRASSPLHAEGNHQLYAHMYFNDITSAKPKEGFFDKVKALLATHPPVEQRIAKLSTYTLALLQQQKREDMPVGGAKTIGGSRGRSSERIN